ncbi:unnamed protein product [Brassica oleracea var. botrytis]|uniref:(rape) hypothetical protein n=1 Tax=Brassica napus TaxID=3708 RepID=A0A816MMR1_BRANA|nr:unnamed protein product [Brassica napus]
MKKKIQKKILIFVVLMESKFSINHQTSCIQKSE